MSAPFARRAEPLRRLVRRSPFVYSRLSHARLAYWRWSVRRGKAAQRPARVPGEVVWIHPDSITHALTTIPFSPPYRDHLSRVRSGRWDRAQAPLGDVGAASQQARAAAAAAPAGDPAEEPGSAAEPTLLVAIDRDGRFLLVEGAEALARARAQKLPAVPAVVTWVHGRWERFANEVYALAQERGGTTYQPTGHPDFSAIPPDHSEERLAILLGGLPVPRGRVLDIGAQWGFFSRELTRRGYDCTAVELASREVYFMRRLRAAHGLDFRIVEGSVFDLKGLGSFDITLALNIFHHFLKTQEAYLALQDLLARLDTRYLIVETHSPDEGQLRHAYKRPTPEEFVEMLSQWAEMPSVEFLARASDGRPLYLLGRG